MLINRELFSCDKILIRWILDFQHNYFPENFIPLPHQIDILTKVSQTIDSTKYIVVSAPTGVGKSFIAKCIANKTCDHSDDFKEAVDSYSFNEISSGNGAFILTVTKR